MVLYPNLISAMAVREVPKNAIANSIGVSVKALQNKLNGKTEFKLREAEKIQSDFFKDIPILELFETAADQSTA